MVAFSVVCFIEDEHVDVAHTDKRVHHALVQHLACAYDDHVVAEMFIPSLLLPERLPHRAANTRNTLVEATLQDTLLLEDEVD
jgi:hypothetical protein